CLKWPAGYWRDEMLFWRARLAGELGDPHLRDSLLERVSTEHPWEFYGMLAANRLGLNTAPDFSVPEIRLSRDPVCSLAVSLTARGYGLPAAEMLRTFSGAPLERRAAALSLMGYHGYSLSLLRGLDSRLREEEGRMLPDSLLLLYFPSPYRGLAASATDTLLLEAHILQGIMREESYFNRWVVSHAGARGVAQLMPSTAADVARWYGLPPLSEEGFFDPAASVPYGALYIDRQYRSFEGERPLFLAAYNAGPANASRWAGMHGWNPRDPEMYIEQITYRETRMYVKKVLRSAWIYERR
ncbi:MAG: lytic transglycosylase domain-containing protein, partial [Candidatus Aegiribacteria sp.]